MPGRPCCWAHCRDPREGELASERTEVRILYTDTSIFFGVMCYDSEPERILASERARDGGDAGSRWDSAFLGDDTFEVLLDTFHSRQDGFLFRTNPLGTKFDSWISDEGRRENSNWDERWNVAAARTELGWVVEIEIPFKSLRMPDKEDQLWGIDFKRNIRRKNEEVAWSNYGRDFQFIQVSQAGDLVGLRDISSELRMRVKPYVTAGVSRVFNRQGEAQTDHLFDAGLEDLKYRITSSLTLDFTVNPDFAQADVDDQVSNLTRFSVFFPEKREFFLENATLFDFGPEGGGGFGQSSTQAFSQSYHWPVRRSGARRHHCRCAPHRPAAGIGPGIDQCPDGRLPGDPGKQSYRTPGPEEAAVAFGCGCHAHQPSVQPGG